MTCASDDLRLEQEWVALVAVVRERADLRAAVEVLAGLHALDEAAAIHRLLWVAVMHEVGLPEAAHLVRTGQQGPEA